MPLIHTCQNNDIKMKEMKGMIKYGLSGGVKDEAVQNMLLSRM